MTRFFGTLLLIALASCTVNSPQPDRSWLAGEWVMMDGVVRFPLTCGSTARLRYDVDGSYSLWGEAGTWRLNGSVLTETMSGFEPLHVDRSVADVGRPYVSTLRWIDRDRFLKRFVDGSVREFRRCPEPR